MRIDNDTYFLLMAKVASLRGTCSRRKVGCILVNSYNHILGTGRNGPPSGFPHCIDTPCKGVDAASGTMLDLCQSTHAEINALIQCKNITEITTCYVTVSPCVSCVKALLNTNCKRIVFAEEYPHKDAKEWWLTRPGRAWDHIQIDYRKYFTDVAADND